MTMGGDMGNKDDIDREDVPPIQPNEGSTRHEFAEHGRKDPKHTTLTGSANPVNGDEG